MGNAGSHALIAMPRTAMQYSAPLEAPRTVGQALPLYRLLEVDTQQRPAVEAFIVARYAEAYGAVVREFLPQLMRLAGPNGETMAVCGLRCASRGPLFLERYLQQPVEQHASRYSGQPVARARIVEIGNLAGQHPGALRLLIPLLTAWLDDAGCHWVVFTGGPRLINGFRRMGTRTVALAPALKDCLPESARADWGRYYDHAPLVMLGDVSAARHSLSGLTDAVQVVGGTADAVPTMCAVQRVDTA